MIYLIDEKTKRQAGYGWNAKRFEIYKDTIESINDYSRFEDDDFMDVVFSKGNVVLFHESFFNGIADNKRGIVKEFNRRIELFGQQERVVFYGGSKSSRKLDGNIAFLPVNVMYEHLGFYLNKVVEGCDDIGYLIWGENPEIDKCLIEGISKANKEMFNENYDYSSVTSKVLVIISSDKNQLYISSESNPQIVIKELYPDNKADEPISDGLLHEYVCDWLSEKEYDSILLPLCFGPVLSDFNGLRLAMHIRCTNTINRNKPISIYGIEDIPQLINNEYFDILKMKATQLVNYDNKSILSSMKTIIAPLEYDELRNEIVKVKINLPQNYIDSHSIANEWAIYRWAKTIGVKDSDIEKVIHTVESNLYFKYLNTIYPVLPQGQLAEKELTVSANIAKKPKVLLVDDEAEKGWYEIFCKIIYDINKFDFDHLDDEFNEKTPDEIVDIVHNKIVADDIDIVILDYRLHRHDFFAEKIEKVTGYKVLNDIKNKINRGVQVVVLSATNKIWNWEALQEAGANAFILKDNPESNYEDLSTIKTIQSFISQLDECCGRLFLKQFYDNYKKLESSFLPRRSKKSSAPLPKEFVDEAMKWFKISCDLFKSGVTEENKAAAFLFLFSVIENIANRVINIDVPENDTDNLGNAIWKYKFRSKNQYIMSFDTNMNKTQYPLTLAYGKPIPWIQKILNAFDFISVYGVSKDIKDLVDKRNNFIHANATTGKKINIIESDVITLHDIVFDGLINIK